MEITMTTYKQTSKASILFDMDVYNAFDDYAHRHGCSKQLAAKLIMEHAMESDVLAGLTERIKEAHAIPSHNKRLAYRKVVDMARLSDEEYMKSVRAKRVSVLSPDMSTTGDISDPQMGELIEGTYQ